MSALAHDLRCPLMSGCTDEELAADHGVTARHVRELRDQMAHDALSADVLATAREIARLTGSAAPLDVIVRRAMRAALRATQRATQDAGTRHSVGGAKGRSVRTQKRTEGTSGIGNRGGARREARAGARVAVDKGRRAALVTCDG